MFSKIDIWLNKNFSLRFPLYEFLSYSFGYPQRYSLLKNLKYGLKLLTNKRNSVRLETSSVCQLRCPVCPTGNGSNKNKAVGWGYLKFEDFRDFVEKNPSVKYIELSNWGEMFLNPELKDIIVYAAEKNISLTANNGVNLNHASDEVLECLVKYKFRSIMVSIDGATNETYRIYRQGGNFDNVIINIKKINHYKKVYNSKYPKLKWQFIIFGHNEHEIPIAEKMAKELDMDFLLKLNHTPSYSPVKNQELVKRHIGINASSRTEFRKNYKRNYLKPCLQLWISPQINWDGKLLGCCVNKDFDFGNVFEKGFKNCIESEDYIYTKNMVMGIAEPRKDLPCYNCIYFNENKSW